MTSCFMKYSGETHSYSLNSLPSENLFKIQPYEFIVNVFTQPINVVIEHLSKLSLITKPAHIKETVHLKLTNHNSFMFYIRREYKVDMLKKEKEMNTAYIDADDSSDSEDSNCEISYTVSKPPETVEMTKCPTKKISLLIINSSSSEDEEYDLIDNE